jgi:hypothetical protein
MEIVNIKAPFIRKAMRNSLCAHIKANYNRIESWTTIPIHPTDRLSYNLGIINLARGTFLRCFYPMFLSYFK